MGNDKTLKKLAQKMKTAAKKATEGQWVAFTDTASRTFSVHTPDDKRCEDVIKWAGFDGQRKARANAEFIAMANPDNVIALIEALEKEEQRIAELEAIVNTPVKLPIKFNLKMGGDKATRTAFKWHNDAIDECSKSILAHGLKVEGEA